MALDIVWLSGFEINSTGTEVTAVSASAPINQTTTVRSGARALQITSLSSGVAKGQRLNWLTSAGNGPYVFLAYFRYATAPSAENCILQLNDQNNLTTPVVYIAIDATGALNLYDEDGQIGSASSALSANTWYRVEILYDRTAAAGSQVVRAYIDGTEFAGSATRSLSAGVLTYNWGGNLLLEANANGNWYFDDMAVGNGSDLIGEMEMVILRPSGAGDNADWTRGGADSGANWSQTDENPPNGPTDYVESNTSGQIDDYAIDDTPAAVDSTDTILVVAVGVSFAVSDATGGDPDFVVRLKDSAGNLAEGSAIDCIATGFRVNNNDGIRVNYSLVSYTRPAGAGSWTKTVLDSSQIGIRESVTDTHFARVSALWAYVGHKPGGGTGYTQDVAGTLTSAGTAVKQTGKNTAGTLTSSGIPVKQTGKQTAGTLTSSGVLSSLRTALASLTGTLTSGGTVTKQTGRGLAGVLSSIGILTDDSTPAMPYDAIPDLVHLYEPARRGLTTYTGDLLRLRRDSDNAESNFPPDANGLLDTAAITTWLGGSNPFIVTVYDQVGSDNPIQATAGKQPVFAASGLAGKPVIRNENLDYLQVTYAGALSQPYHYYVLTALDAAAVNAGDMVLIDGDNVAAEFSRIQQWSSPSPDSWMIYAGAVLSDGDTTADPTLLTVLWNGASSDLRLNGTSAASGNAGTSNADGITIGSIANAGFYWIGDIAMIAIADPSHDTTERDDMETAINDFWFAVGNEFFQSVAGVLTSAGAIVKATGKGLAGTLSSSGILSTSRAGLLSLAGTLTSSGTVTTLRTAVASLAGVLTSSGTVAKGIGKGLAGTLETAGTLVKQTAKALAGTLTSSGALATMLSGAATGIIHLTAKARDFTLTAQTRAFSLAAKVRAFALSLKDRD